MMESIDLEELRFYPVTKSRWGHLEMLFGRRGACGGCWCMHWRFLRPKFESNKGIGNKRALKKIVESGARPGILAYADREPIGWCAVAPRSSYPRLDRSRVLLPVDDQPVWSISCLFVAKPFRRSGVSAALLRAAVDFAFKQGARIVEGYPFDPKTSPQPDPFVWTGLAKAYERAGFVEVARRSKTRPIMRSYAEQSHRAKQDGNQSSRRSS